MARILVIEDNPANMQLMTYLLQAFGHTPVEAGDGEAGLEAIQREVFDLILCDIQLPKLDGYEIVRQLKHDPRQCAIPLVAVTAFAMVGDRDKVLGAGFDGYIPKPIAPETFVKQVEAFLKPRRHEGTNSMVASSAMPTPFPARSSQGSILIVDNRPENIEVLRAMLEPFGYETDAAFNIQEALAQVKAKRPLLILLDVYLAGESGYDLIPTLKADPALKAVPIAMISSTSWAERDAAKALSLGAVTYITRPIEPEILLSKITAMHRQVRSAPPRATLLIVDNSPINLEIMRGLLETSGYRIMTAPSVADGLTLARQTPPDLILSDVHMPEQGGYEFIRLAKADPQLQHVPFAFISSTLWRQEEPARALALGAVNFIQRPIEPQQLLEEIEKCLRRVSSD